MSSQPDTPVPSYRHPLPAWLAYGAPIFMMVYPFVLLVPALNWEKGLNREFGLIENLTALFLFAAFVVALRSLPMSLGKLHALWLMFLAFGAFVFFGEEISWGQHFFGWDTPEDWKELNRQNETNIHNLNGTVEFIFTKIIRKVLSTGCIVGGLVAPLICLRLKSQFSPQNPQFWLWPSISSAFVGVLANMVNIPAKIANRFDADLPNYMGDRVGELKEAFLALFILLYAVVQYRVLKQLRKS